MMCPMVISFGDDELRQLLRGVRLFKEGTTRDCPKVTKQWTTAAGSFEDVAGLLQNQEGSRGKPSKKVVINYKTLLFDSYRKSIRICQKLLQFDFSQMDYAIVMLVRTCSINFNTKLNKRLY